MKKLSVTAIILFFSGLALANASARQQWAEQTSALDIEERAVHAQPKTNIELTEDFCPAPDTLVKGDDLLWAAPNGWKSTSPSFLRSVKTFSGARWVGVSVGEIVCTYMRSIRGEFPINLHRRLLVVSPSGGNWSTDKGGHKECQGADPKECPFSVQKSIETKDIYEELDYFKGEPIEDRDHEE